MARELACPQCAQVLTIPESLLGQTVKCPGCGGLYRSTPEGTLLKDETTLPPGTNIQTPGPTESAPADAASVPCPYCRELISPKATRCPFCNEETARPDAMPEQYIRRDVIPHRGNVIQLLGILSLVSILAVCFCPLLCAIGVGLGSAAWLMANTDLRKMYRGDMDPGGEGPTNTGRICGIIGLILNGLFLLACGTYIITMLIWSLLQDKPL
jgi:hypothetical protein